MNTTLRKRLTTTRLLETPEVRGWCASRPAAAPPAGPLDELGTTAGGRFAPRGAELLAFALDALDALDDADRNAVVLGDVLGYVPPRLSPLLGVADDRLEPLRRRARRRFAAAAARRLFAHADRPEVELPGADRAILLHSLLNCLRSSPDAPADAAREPSAATIDALHRAIAALEREDAVSAALVRLRLVERMSWAQLQAASGADRAMLHERFERAIARLDALLEP